MAVIDEFKSRVGKNIRLWIWLNMGMDYWEEELPHHFRTSAASAWMLFYEESFNQTLWAPALGLMM